jgi:hypothetical protein
MVLPHTVLLGSKMFVGGLNWDTTDGISSLYVSIYVALIFNYYRLLQFTEKKV